MVRCFSAVASRLAAEPCIQAVPLFAAVTASHPALLDCGAPMEACNAAGQTPLLVAPTTMWPLPGS